MAIISGSEFIKLNPNTKFYRVKRGLEDDDPKTISFVDKDKLSFWTCNNDYVSEIIILEESNIKIYKDRYETDKYIILDNKEYIKGSKIWESRDFCLEAIRRNFNNGKFIKEEMIFSFIMNDEVSGINIKHIKTLQTPELCLKVALSYPNYIKYLNKELLTNEICLKALEKGDPFLYKLYRDVVTDVRFHELGVEKCHKNIEFVPEEYQTEEMCYLSFNKDNKNIIYISKRFLTTDLYVQAFLINEDIYEYYKKKFFWPLNLFNPVLNNAFKKYENEFLPRFK